MTITPNGQSMFLGMSRELTVYHPEIITSNLDHPAAWTPANVYKALVENRLYKHPNQIKDKVTRLDAIKYALYEFEISPKNIHFVLK